MCDEEPEYPVKLSDGGHVDGSPVITHVVPNTGERTGNQMQDWHICKKRKSLRPGRLIDLIFC